MHANQVSIQTKLAILATSLLSFIGILVETSLNVTFPTMTKQFNLPLSTVQLLTSGYLLMVTIVMSTSAFLIKRFNARGLFRFAIIISLLGTLLCALTQNYWILLSGRLLQAVATGISTPLMFHVILSLIPKDRLGTYVGLASMITSFAPALGPTYGGLLNYYLSWHAIFWFAIPLLLIATFVGEVSLRLEAENAGTNFDTLGVIWLSIFLFSFIEVFNQASSAGLFSFNVVLTFIITLITFGLMLFHSKKSAHPLLNFNILRQKIVALRGTNYVILQFINIGISFVIPVFAQNYLGANSLSAGLVLLPGSLLGAVIAPVAGTLYDRYGATLVLLISNSSMIIGSLLLWYFARDASLILITGLYMFLRFGFNFGFGNTLSDASKSLPPNDQTDLNSILNTGQQYAGALGTSVLSFVFSSTQLSHPNFTTHHNAVLGAQNAFGVLTILALVALSTTIIVALSRRHQSI